MKYFGGCSSRRNERVNLLRGADVGCGGAVRDDGWDDSVEYFGFDGLFVDGVVVLTFG